MTLQKSNKKKVTKFKNIKFFNLKNTSLNKIKIDPINIFEEAKSIVGDYYIKYKKD